MAAFEVEKTHVRRRGEGRWPLVEFTVTTPSFPGIVVEMAYSLPGGIALQSVKISSVADEAAENVAPVTPGTVRNLPLATWDRSLVMRVWSVLRHPAYSDLYDLGWQLPQSKGNYEPRAAVAELYPGLAEDDTKAGQRRYSSMMHLAEVARTYADLILAGKKNPTGIIAEAEGVKAVTVRSWLHRAKAAGLYPLFGLEEAPRRSPDTPN